MRGMVLESQKIAEFSMKLCTHCGNEKVAEGCPGRRAPGPSLLLGSIPQVHDSHP